MEQNLLRQTGILFKYTKNNFYSNFLKPPCFHINIYLNDVTNNYCKTPLRHSDFPLHGTLIQFWLPRSLLDRLKVNAFVYYWDFAASVPHSRSPVTYLNLHLPVLSYQYLLYQSPCMTSANTVSMISNTKSSFQLTDALDAICSPSWLTFANLSEVFFIHKCKHNNNIKMLSQVYLLRMHQYTHYFKESHYQQVGHKVITNYQWQSRQEYHIYELTGSQLL